MKPIDRHQAPSVQAPESPARRWVLLDRDGVINQENPGSYILEPDQWIPIPGSVEAIARLRAAGIGVVILTNQSAIGRGLLDLPTLESIHLRLKRTLEKAGGEIAGIFFCPHHPDEGCECRKPNAGLIRQAEAALGCSLHGAPLVGDQLSDLQAARRAGCRPILVRSGRGNSVALKENGLEEIATYENLSEAVSAILEDTTAHPKP